MILRLFYLSVFFLASSSVFGQINLKQNSSQIFTSSNLPIFSINTNGQQILDEDRIVAEMGITFNENGERNNLTDGFNHFSGRIEIEYRGSSSAAYPKKQYRLETQDSLGENLNVSLCGLPKENDWILNGPYNDKSLVRNVLAYGLSNDLGWYASRTVFCELILNNEYQGLYILMETIKRDKNRINITKMSDTASADEASGGYIVKVDRLEEDYWQSNNGTFYNYHYPKPDEISFAQKIYIQNFFETFEAEINLNSSNILEIINLNSFVDHFILNEFCKNVDAYRLSSYMYKDRDDVDGRLYAGPIWDFNLTFGDAWIDEENGVSTGWQVDYSKRNPYDGYRVPFWWETLKTYDYFNNALSERWYSLRKDLLSLENLFNRVDSLSEYIKEARIRNFEKWNDVLQDRTYDQEILIMKGWISRRLTWMDENIEEIVSLENKNEIYTDFTLEQNYPNPFNPITTISYTIPESDKNDNSIVQILIYNILGQQVETLVNQKQSAGNHQVIFNAAHLPSGIYYYTFKSGNIIRTKKMILLK